MDETYEPYINKANNSSSRGDVILVVGALGSPQLMMLSGNYIKGNYIFALNPIETIDILQNDTIYQIFSIDSKVILITKIPNLKKKTHYLSNIQQFLKLRLKFLDQHDP